MRLCERRRCPGPHAIRCDCPEVAGSTGSQRTPPACVVARNGSRLAALLRQIVSLGAGGEVFCRSAARRECGGGDAAGVRCGTKPLAPCGAPTADCELGCGGGVFVGASQGANADGVMRQACVVAPNPSRLAALLRQIVSLGAGRRRFLYERRKARMRTRPARASKHVTCGCDESMGVKCAPSSPG